MYSYVGATHSAKVHALEPIPALADWIRRIAPANVVVHQCAASDHATKRPLYIPSFDGMRTEAQASLQPIANAALTPIEIETRPLDSMEFGRVAFIKTSRGMNGPYCTVPSI